VVNKKIFVVADVNGHYTELMEALRSAGFDEKNEAHIFLSVGDLFDRGKENEKIYSFVRGLPRKILLKGNHEDMLCRILKEGDVTDTDRANETDVTVKELFGEDSIDENGYFDRNTHSEKVAEVLYFIDTMLNYYETERYIFTHGWLPIVFEGRYPTVDPCFRNASDEEWQEARLLEWQQLYEVKALLSGKTIVCGHRPSRLGYMFDSFREPDCSEPFYGEGMIAIDAGTVRSKCVNVLVIEDADIIEEV
jgi:serine/threonine protein phosphatase 1